MIKIILFLVVSLGMYLLSILNVNAFVITNNTTPLSQVQCTGDYQTTPQYFNTAFQPFDIVTFNTFVQLQPVISPSMTDNTKTTKIGIYNSLGILNCGNMNNWIYPSGVVPVNKTTPAINRVIAVMKGPSDPCRIISLPPNRNTIVAQFVFNNAYREVASWAASGTSYQVGITLPPPLGVTIIPLPTTYTITPDYNLSSIVKIEPNPECLNVTAMWCGDGVRDIGYETCDSADVTHAGWGTGGCSATCTPITTPIVPPPVTPPSGGPVCTPGNFTRDAGGVVPAPISPATLGLCSVGNPGNFSDILNGANHRYSWSCEGISAGTACTAYYNGGSPGGPFCGDGVKEISEQCDDGNRVSGDGCSATCMNEIPSGCTPAINGVITCPGENSYCGNGFVEQPNAVGQYENCDTTAAWCTDSTGRVICNIATTNPGSDSPGGITITTPGSLTSVLLGDFRLILGDGVPVFDPQDRISFEVTDPVYLNGISAKVTNRSPLINGAAVSKTINDVGLGGTIRFEVSRTYNPITNALESITYEERVYPASSTVLFQGSELQGFIGNATSFPESYKDTNTTLPAFLGTGLYASIQYLESPFHIRVSKPMVSNASGGSTFIGSLLGYDINAVTANFMDALRSGNFTTSTVNTSSTFALSSATTSTSNNTVLSQTITAGSMAEGLKITNASSLGAGGFTTNIAINSEYDITAQSTWLGDNTNIRVFAGGDVSINGPIDLTGVKTIIIENGNLIINNDIHYADLTSSVAWVVKSGNIIVADTVQQIAGVYVTLAGAILSNGVSTPNRLTVEGSLYGNTSDLVNNRSYVRGQTGYTALNVGVVVNYSNRAIMYPPPFLSNFLDQYSLQRVVQ